MADEQEQIAVPEENAAPEINPAETPSESATDETTPKPEEPSQDRLQKRIDKLVRDRENARRDAERWREEALRHPAQSQQTPNAPVKPVTEGKPKADDFETAEEFVEALADWKLDQRQNKERETRQQQEQQTNQQQLQSKVAEDLVKARAEYADFDDVMEDAVLPGNNPEAVKQIQQSEDSGKLFYHLVKDQTALQRIWSLNDPAKIARELGKIEARIASAPVATPPAPSTSTPPPLKPVPASRQTVANTPADDDTEWLRQRRAELAKRR